MTVQNVVPDRRTSVKNTSLMKGRYFCCWTRHSLSTLWCVYFWHFNGIFPLFLNTHLNSVLIIHALKQGCLVVKLCLSDI